MYKTSIETDEIKENVLAGIVGAFLFSLVGGILWFVLYQIGYIASASGLVGVICAVKGYTIFAKTKNKVSRGEGLIMIGMYAAYFVYILLR